MIPVSAPVLGERELEYVTECIRSGWISSAGHFLEEFEQRWAAYCGRRYGVAVSSGTAALQVALGVLALEPGDEVILPTFTMIAPAVAVVTRGAVPVVIDAQPDTWCMNVAQMESRVTARTRVLLPVHIYGHPVDMDAVLAVAARHNLAVIEDAAEAHGAEYFSAAGGRWRRCGGFGTLSCFSFYGNKIVTTGEGGMVLTDDPLLAAKARSLRNLGFGTARRFEHVELGYNFRLSNVQAAIGLAQLERLDELLARKRAIGREYSRLLRAVHGLQLPVEASWARSVYWMYGVVLQDDVPFDADEFGARLRAGGVETRPFFLGMHEQPVFHGRGLLRGESHPVSERLARRGVYLPSGAGLTDDDLARVVDAVRHALA
jgi:perosamine synthetase